MEKGLKKFERMNNILRFEDEKALSEEVFKDDIKTYLKQKFAMGATNERLFDPILMKLTKNPDLFMELATPFIKLMQDEYSKYMESLINDPKYIYIINSYMLNNGVLIDYRNILESELAETWAKRQPNNLTMLKHIIVKRAFDLGLKEELNPRCFLMPNGQPIMNRDLSGRKKEHKIVINPFSLNGFACFKVNDLKQSLILAFKELYYLKQNEIFKSALTRQNEFTPQLYRWLKEVQLIVFDRNYYLENIEHFDLEVEARLMADKLFQHEFDRKVTITKPNLTEAIYENIDQYNLVEERFAHLDNMANLVSNFPILRKEFKKDGTKKDLAEMVSVYPINILDLELLYKSAIKLSADELSMQLENLTAEQLDWLGQAFSYHIAVLKETIKNGLENPKALTNITTELSLASDYYEIIKNYNKAKGKKFVKACHNPY